MYMSNCEGSFGLIRGKTYRNGKIGKSAFGLRGQTVTMTLDMDSRSMSLRLASGGKECTMDDLPSSVYPICGVDGNWVRIVESSNLFERLKVGDMVMLSAIGSTDWCLKAGNVGKIMDIMSNVGR
jgi:hypothetical protein